MSSIFGCDIGNGYGFISLIDDGEGDPQSMLPVLPDLNSSEGMPTAAYVMPPDGADVMVYDADRGGSAARRIKRDPAGCVRAVKTRLREERIDLRGRSNPISPYVVYGAVARDLVRLGNLQCAKDRREPIYDLVMTYPASLNGSDQGLDILNRMQAAIQAVDVDGHSLRVVGRIPEPAAVAIDYLSYLQRNVSATQQANHNQGEFTAVVYDLGHGTFDTAVVTARSEGEPFQVWDVDGLPDVGGKDFDSRLLEELTNVLLQEHGYELVNELEREDLLREAIEAKHELSIDDEVVIQHLDRRDGSSYLDVTITRERFEELTRDLLLLTIEVTQEIVSNQLEAGRDIDAIILSGGASQMPMVRKALEDGISPSLPVHQFRPSKAVSFGAARYALGLTQPEPLKQVEESARMPSPAASTNSVAQLHTKHGYGVLVEEPGSLDGSVRVLIGSGVSLPARSRVVQFRCARGRNDCRIYRPAPSDEEGASASVEDCVSLVWLHFDVPEAGIYQLTVEVDANYDIFASLSRGGDSQAGVDSFVQKCSTADSRNAERRGEAV